MEKLLKVGIIASTHGVRGEVKVFPTTDDVNRFKGLKEVLLDTGRERIPLEIESVRFFKQFAILKFKGIDSLNDVEIYKGKSLLVTRENAVKLEENEYFIADLIGMEVVSDDGSVKGILKDVMQTGANDVYVIQADETSSSAGRKKELLIPAIKECILDVDMEQRTMRIHLLPGLLEED